MQFLQFLSESIIPITIFMILSYALLNRQNVYQDFLKGAKDGFLTVIDILPTLIGLMTAVGILRASGFLDFFSDLLKILLGPLHIPTELLPVAVIKMFSSSAATGLLLDLFKTYGTDSFIGLSASIMMSCTETIFYTCSRSKFLTKLFKTFDKTFREIFPVFIMRNGGKNPPLF